MEFNKPKPLNLAGDLAKNFNEFQEEVLEYFEATETGTKSAGVQIARLKNLLGRDAVRLYKTLTTIKPEEETVNDILSVLKFHCIPKKNETILVFNFFNRKQCLGEPFENFYAELRALATPCEFGDQEDKLLRAQIILGVNSQSIKQHLLREDTTLNKVVEYCKSVELAEKNLKTIEDGGRSSQSDIFKTVHKVNEMMRNITKLEKAIAEKEGFMSLAHTRLGNRAHRPEMELCRLMCPAVGSVSNVWASMSNVWASVSNVWASMSSEWAIGYIVWTSLSSWWANVSIECVSVSTQAVPEQLPHIIDQLSLCVRSCSFPAESFRLYTVLQKPCAAVMDLWNVSFCVLITCKGKGRRQGSQSVGFLRGGSPWEVRVGARDEVESKLVAEVQQLGKTVTVLQEMLAEYGTLHSYPARPAPRMACTTPGLYPTLLHFRLIYHNRSTHSWSHVQLSKMTLETHLTDHRLDYSLSS
uniref:Uncharacterized protein n=1 Tax=Timema bartmani TaxID=61472 RepID=A0A7R9I4J1_9NEOP|nr:unnamed protein product [Timema bartmani]